FFGKTGFESFDNVYNTLLHELNGIYADPTSESLPGLYLDKLREMSKIKPELIDLVNKLENADEFTKARFAQAFNLDKNNFIGTEISYKTDDNGNLIPTFTVKNFTTVADKANFNLNNWNYTFKSKFTEGK